MRGKRLRVHAIDIRKHFGGRAHRLLPRCTDHGIDGRSARRVSPCGRFPMRSRPTAGRCRRRRRRGSPVSTPHEVLRFDGNTPPQPPDVRERGDDRGLRSPRSSAIRTAASPRCSTRSPSTPASRRSASCSEPEPTTCSCSADARSPGRATSCACSTSRRTRSSASPPGSPAPTWATSTPCSRTAAGRITRRASLGPLPDVRPLVVDEAYFEFGGETAAGTPGVIAVRTFSKAFGLAAARVGYAVADAERRAGARRAPGPAADHDALGRAGARSASCRPAGRERDDRRARAARLALCASSGSSRSSRTRTSSTSRCR